VRAGDRLAAAPVVEERVDRFLQHPPLVPDDDLRSVQLDEPLEAAVTVDDAAIEIVEVRRREAATVERNERTEVRRKHRNHRQHHPRGSVTCRLERLDDLETLGELLAL